MCQHNETEEVEVTIPADLSHTGKAYRKRAKIDKCLSPIVRALSDNGIHMRGSCCSYGVGEIGLDDGRLLLVLDRDTAGAYEHAMRENQLRAGKTVISTNCVIEMLRRRHICVDVGFADGIKRIMWRLRVATWLMRLAAAVAGFEYEEKRQVSR